jgi:3-hydroxypropanoate dehydrogenase
MNTIQAPVGRLDTAALDQLFREARSFSKWQDKPVADELIEELYELLKFGPTSANTTPARFLFLTTPAAKERLASRLPEMNQEKARTAPVVAVVAYDLEFYHKLDKLMPFRDIKSWFADPAQALRTATQSGTLQGAYLILAARALGLDCGPMLGDLDQIDREFFAGTTWRANFVCALGYGDRDQLHPRLPRLDFDEAVTVL